ncbi:hypothetical protein CBOM_05693 [Ceraceosorus bombacis]|uniref:Uncharacterized protein n=1 Tax=Ceraceosorus bombacis TaxID=401625 RepID=A0A0P1BSI1_9BASI|nr:hypothetical protein CBOM_05693 [Ceraceosorus bombacis]
MALQRQQDKENVYRKEAARVPSCPLLKPIPNQCPQDNNPTLGILKMKVSIAEQEFMTVHCAWVAKRAFAFMIGLNLQKFQELNKEAEALKESCRLKAVPDQSPQDNNSTLGILKMKVSTAEPEFLTAHSAWVATRAYAFMAVKVERTKALVIIRQSFLAKKRTSSTA